MKNLKKIGIFALIVALLLTVFACASTSSKSDKTNGKQKPLEISVYIPKNLKAPSKNNKMYKWISENFGVTFKWNFCYIDEQEYFDSLIDSGSLPDLVENTSEHYFYNAGVLRPLDDLIEKYGPNLKAHYAKYWENMKEADGHIYCLPSSIASNVTDTFYKGNAFWIQKCVLKEFGYPKIKTITELFDLLEKYAAKYPEINGKPTIPFSIVSYSWEFFNIINTPNFLFGYPNEGDLIVSEDNGVYKMKYLLRNEEGKKWYKLVNEKLHENIVDNELFSDTKDDFTEKISDGRLLCTFIQGWELDESQENLVQQGMYERTYAPISIVWDETIRPHYRELSAPDLHHGFGISKKCSETKAIQIIKFMDEMLKEENQKILQWGLEGDGWQLDSQGQPFCTQEQLNNQKDSYWISMNKADLWFEVAPKLEGTFSDGTTCKLGEEKNLEESNELDVELWNAYGVSSNAALVDPNPPYNKPWYPMWEVKVPPEGTEEKKVYDALDGIHREYLPKLILASDDAEFEATWTAYQNAMVDTNIAIYEAFMQKRLEERIAK